MEFDSKNIQSNFENIKDHLKSKIYSFIESEYFANTTNEILISNLTWIDK